MNFLSFLVSKGLISQELADEVNEIIQEKSLSIEEVLEQRDVDMNKFMELKSAYFEIPVKEIDLQTITRELLEYVPQESALHYRLVPITVEDGVLQIGTLDPDSIEARDALTFLTSRKGMPYKMFLISERDYKQVMEKYSSLTGEVKQALNALESEIDEPSQPTTEQEMRIVEDAPVTKIVATILRYATEGRASDIHIEHTSANVRVRFRVDGELNTSLTLPKNVQSAVIARIKILSSMRLDERRKPQDGRFSARIEGRKVDFRVSTLPTYYGEKVVMRILDQEKGVLPLDQIGLSEHNLGLIKEAIAQPHGLILISGPTGSGKTTTLYSMLGEVDRDTNNVLSLEDPIEYNIEGISQSQMRSDIGYTFANGLRTALRQDPDIIMVGEIRDKETGQLAIQAALTGHLVFSTIHTNNAIGVVPRLVDMGVDPYLIAPTLKLALAQRLVSRRCSDAGEKTAVEGSIKAMIQRHFKGLPKEMLDSIKVPSHVYRTAPGPDCPNGTRGRLAVMEAIKVTPEIEHVVLHDPTEPAIEAVARKQGMLTLREDALLKAFRGDIPIEEVTTV